MPSPSPGTAPSAGAFCCCLTRSMRPSRMPDGDLQPTTRPDDGSEDVTAPDAKAGLGYSVQVASSTAQSGGKAGVM